MSDRISAFHADTDATKAPTRVSRIGVLAAQPRTHRAGCESWITVTASEWANSPALRQSLEMPARWLRAGRGISTPTRISPGRSEEHTSELQSLMRISYAVFCLKKKKKYQ